MRDMRTGQRLIINFSRCVFQIIVLRRGMASRVLDLGHALRIFKLLLNDNYLGNPLAPSKIPVLSKVGHAFRHAREIKTL